MRGVRGRPRGLPARRGLIKLDVVVIGTSEWLLVRSIAHYTTLEFARAGRVLYVEPFGSWLTLARAARRQNRRRGRQPRLERVGETLWVYRPPPVGLPGVTRAGRVSDANGVVLATLLNRILRRLGFKQPIVLSFLYNSATLLRRLGARLRVYECTDFDAALAPDARRRARVLSLEGATVRAADLVFAVTDELAGPLRALNPAVHEVNCAADLDFFGRALLPETRVPADIAALPRPVIGYMGGIDPWKIDVPLLLAMARAHPEWSIALAGYVWFGFDPKPLRACANIHVLGPKDYEDFPGYLKGMDVCIMPFPLNDNTLHGDALKLYEYLAAGKPVVSTAVPAARRLACVVRIAETPPAFIEAVEAVLRDPPDGSVRRLAAIRPHSWAARHRQKMALIGASLDRPLSR